MDIELIPSKQKHSKVFEYINVRTALPFFVLFIAGGLLFYMFIQKEPPEAPLGTPVVRGGTITEPLDNLAGTANFEATLVAIRGVDMIVLAQLFPETGDPPFEVRVGISPNTIFIFTDGRELRGLDLLEGFDPGMKFIIYVPERQLGGPRMSAYAIEVVSEGGD